MLIVTNCQTFWPKSRDFVSGSLSFIDHIIPWGRQRSSWRTTSPYSGRQEWSTESPARIAPRCTSVSIAFEECFRLRRLSIPRHIEIFKDFEPFLLVLLTVHLSRYCTLFNEQPLVHDVYRALIIYAAYIVMQNDFEVADCFAEFSWQSRIPSTPLQCFLQQVYTRTIHYASMASSLFRRRGRSRRVSSIVHILEEWWGSYIMCNSEYCHPNTCRLKCLLVCHSPSWGHESALQMSGHCHHGNASK